MTQVGKPAPGKGSGEDGVLKVRCMGEPLLEDLYDCLQRHDFDSERSTCIAAFPSLPPLLDLATTSPTHSVDTGHRQSC